MLLVLTLPDPEHLRLTLPTRTPGGWFTVLHLDFLGTLDLNLLAALHAVCGHNTSL